MTKREGALCLGMMFGLLLSIAPVQASLTGHIKGDSHVGCVDRDLYDKLGRLASDHDLEAFKKLLTVAVVAGRCIVFKDGQQVYEVDTAMFSGLMQVRLKGDTREFWIKFEAVELDQ